MSKFHLMKKDDEGEWVEMFKKSDYPEKDAFGKPLFQIGYDSQSKARTNAEVLSKSRKTEIAIMYHRTGHHEIVAVFNNGKLVGEEKLIKTREKKQQEGI
jgi:endo-alpha-1,4-polygalactosaminidase (GH114 family)